MSHDGLGPMLRLKPGVQSAARCAGSSPRAPRVQPQGTQLDPGCVTQRKIDQMFVMHPEVSRSTASQLDTSKWQTIRLMGQTGLHNQDVRLPLLASQTRLQFPSPKVLQPIGPRLSPLHLPVLYTSLQRLLPLRLWSQNALNAAVACTKGRMEGWGA